MAVTITPICLKDMVRIADVERQHSQPLEVAIVLSAVEMMIITVIRLSDLWDAGHVRVVNLILRI